MEEFKTTFLQEHDIQKIKTRIESAHQTNSKGKYVILVSTGAYNPIHNLHIDNMNAVKKELEKDESTCVICGIISPSHDNYVSNRMRQQNLTSIDGYDRIKMSDLQCKQSDWLVTSVLECNATVFIDYNEVCFTVKQLFINIFDNLISSNIEQISIQYVCGIHHAINCVIPVNYGNEITWCDHIYAIYQTSVGDKKDECAKINGYDKMSVVTVPTTCDDYTQSNAITAELQNPVPNWNIISDYCGTKVAAYLFGNEIGIKKLDSKN